MLQFFETSRVSFPFKCVLPIAISLLLGACTGKDDASTASVSPNGTQAAAQSQESRVNVFTTNQFQPLPAGTQTVESLSPEVKAARLRLLGPDAMDPEVVRIWWVGVSSFIVSMKGHLFLLDAWEIVGLHADYLPIGREDLAAIKPEAIFVGHGHFDHAADVGYVAGNSGALVVGGDTVCDIARQRAAGQGLKADFPCVQLGTSRSPAPGSTLSLKVWEDLPPVIAVAHTHSAAEPADLLEGGRPLVYIPEVLTFATYLNTSPQEALMFLGTLRDDGGVGQPEGGTWAYHFRFDDFALFWHDSTGVMKPTNADSNKHANSDAVVY